MLFRSKAAVKSLVADLNSSDLIGLLDDLPPGERDAISKPVQQTVEQLKRNDVLRPDANLNKVGGVQVKASNLTFASETIPVNDHVRIVQLTGGTITLNADLAKAPFTSDFLHAAFPGGAGSRTAESVDIGQEVKKRGKPIRIATQKVDGGWYPSLLYTIADNAVTSSGLQAPSAADRVPANGAGSPDAAVEGVITAALNGDLRRVGELLSPDELAVIHDYGKLILDRVHYNPPNVKVRNIGFQDIKTSDGTRVEITAVEISTPDSGTVKVQLSGDCATVTVQGHAQRMCSADLIGQLVPFLGKDLTAAQQTALADLFSGIMHATGVETTEVGGKWYVNPLRSYFHLFDALLSGLKGNDAKVLLQLIGDR